MLRVFTLLRCLIKQPLIGQMHVGIAWTGVTISKVGPNMAEWKITSDKRLRCNGNFRHLSPSLDSVYLKWSEAICKPKVRHLPMPED